MIINTGTTIITFLMVFLIQKAQNKDSLAIQLKLNELVAAHEFASNRLVNVENMTEDELRVIHKYYSKLSDFTKKEETMQQSHSIDEAHEHHDFKKRWKELKDKMQKKEKSEDNLLYSQKKIKMISESGTAIHQSIMQIFMKIY